MLQQDPLWTPGRVCHGLATPPTTTLAPVRMTLPTCTVTARPLVTATAAEGGSSDRDPPPPEPERDAPGGDASGSAGGNVPWENF